MLICLAVGVLFLVLIWFLADRRSCIPMVHLHGRHVLITGGSKGIGRALATEAVLRGAHVTIVAKTEQNLRDTVSVLEQLKPDESQKVQWYSHDLMNNWNTIGHLVRKIECDVGTIDLLINNAGGAVQAPVDDIDDGQFLNQMKLNYLSAACMTKHVLIGMKAAPCPLPTGRRIAFLSSQAGQVGLYGYSAYSASKFALRGFAEAVQMEARRHNVWLTVAYPPHTDTEGFKQEWQETPELTKRLTSGSGEPMTPDQVARALLDCVAKGKFDCHFGLEGWMLSNLCAGMAPVNGWLSALCQATLMGSLRLVGLCYLKKFNFIVSK